MAKTTEELQAIIDLYEKNGGARLYYSLQRKMNEMAELLNKHSLVTLDVADAKDKTFDRLKTIWNDAAGIAVAVKTLGDAVGITGDEQKDINKKVGMSFLDKAVS
jgi:hypothetical protein